jgi:hypothetical protein
VTAASRLRGWKLDEWNRMTAIKVGSTVKIAYEYGSAMRLP